jgi:Cu+-exporting ATPase
MKVVPERAAGSQDHAGRTYYFCCRGCLERFKADPERYLQKSQSPSTLVQLGSLQPLERVQLPPPATGDDVMYTCPMHPQIRQQGPGACPICGMALEPEMVTETEAPNPELVDMTRRFWIAAVLSIPVLIFGMQETQRWMQFALATPVVLWAGWPLFVRAWASLINRSPNMFTLIGMGVGTAYIYSGIAMLAPGVFPRELAIHGLATGLFRSRRRYHCPGPAGTGSRVKGAFPHQQRDQGTAWLAPKTPGALEEWN